MGQDTELTEEEIEKFFSNSVPKVVSLRRIYLYLEKTFDIYLYFFYLFINKMYLKKKFVNLFTFFFTDAEIILPKKIKQIFNYFFKKIIYLVQDEKFYQKFFVSVKKSLF